MATATNTLTSSSVTTALFIGGKERQTVEKMAIADPAKPGAGKGGPPEVGVVTVSSQDAPLELELPGRLSASQVAEIRPQVTGIVMKRLFTEGSTVKAGQPLYQLDAASFEAERARAAAALQKAEASLAVARTKATRDAELLKADAISRQAADDSCRRLAGLYPGTLHLGIDVLFGADLASHAVVEANAFGDLLPGLTRNGFSVYRTEIRAALRRL